MAIAFCVLSTPRTGSSYLCSLLGSHPRICCHRELFSPNWIEATEECGLPVGAALVDQELRAREPLRWLDAVIAETMAYDSKWLAVGFKLHLRQVPSVLERILFEPGVAIVMLDRADRVAQYGSRKLADTTLQYWATSSEQTNTMTVPFDASEFEVFARQHEDLYGMARAVLRERTDVVDLDYDALLDADVHRQVLKFLGVEPQVKLLAPHVRQGPEQLLARFSNPDDVVAALRLTKWARWLPQGAAR